MEGNGRCFMWDFLDSTFFQTLAVVGTGVVAYDIYKKQQANDKKTYEQSKLDEIKVITTLILMEIDNVEKILTN